MNPSSFDGHLYFGSVTDAECRPPATTPSWLSENWAVRQDGASNPKTSLTKTLVLGEHLKGLLAESGVTERRMRGTGANSIRNLARRLGHVVAISTMWRALTIYELAEQYPEVWHYKHIGIGHLSVLLGVRGPARLALMRRAEQLRLSKRTLEREATAIRSAEARGLDPLVHCGLQAFVANPD